MRIFILTAAVFLASQLGYAQNSSQLKFIENREKRPSVAEILSDAKNLETFPPAGHSAFLQNGRMRNFENDWIPQLIVALEKTFPNATYAFLGRDMDMIADAIQAYYISQGQFDRVVRIPFSTPSLAGTSPEILKEFLVDRGLVVDRRQSPSGPFVIVDFTGFSIQGRGNRSLPSQTRYIFESVASAMRNEGLSSQAILDRLNVFTLAASSEAINGLRASDAELASVKEIQVSYYESHWTLKPIFRAPFSYELAAYHSEWHDKYGPIFRNPAGKLETSISGTQSEWVRNSVYADMIEVIRRAISPSFHSQVEEIAAAYGVKISHPQSSTQSSAQSTVIPKSRPQNARNEYLRAIREQLFVLPPLDRSLGDALYKTVIVNQQQRVRLSENGRIVASVFLHRPFQSMPSYFTNTLIALLKLYEKEIVGVRDFRRIFALVLEAKAIGEDNKFFEIIKANSEVLPLKLALSRPREREKYSSLPGIAGENYRLILQKTGIEAIEDCDSLLTK